MDRTTRKRLILGGVTVLVLAALVWAFLPKPVPVRTAAVTRAPLEQIVEEEGRTEVADRYAVSAPVAGFVRRIALEVGDPVARGQVVAQLEPPRTPILDPRSRQEAAARVDAARAGVAQAEAAAAQAAADQARTERLAAGGSATRQALEQARAAGEQARARLASARAELAGAQAALRQLGAPAGGAAQAVVAPAAGRVLAVRRRSEGQVLPGDTLLVVGNTARLQVRADLLSEDAVRVRPGTRVLLEQWGGDAPLQAVVTRVEPQGFTAVSSLGVEEQRVPVVAELTSAPALWGGRLGSGYRVLARFVVWSAPAAVQVPSSALFRQGDAWALFVVERGRARRRTVQVGHQAGLQSEILSGVRPGEQVIVHPANTVEDGGRVSAEADG